MDKTITAITSEDWRIVREFVRHVRLHAHETVVDKSVIQDILDVVDRHNMATVQHMIKHEKRITHQTAHTPSGIQTSEADHGIQK